MAHLKWYQLKKKKEKNIVKVGTPLKKLSGSAQERPTFLLNIVKQCRLRSDKTLCGVLSVSSLFAYNLFY